MTLDTAETLGRTAAHTGISAEQLAAVFTALRAPARLARQAETCRRLRLVWIAEGMGSNNAEGAN